ncbi:MAG: ABC transporter substrate-binding protein [Syntrophaceticus schinkii]|jgi:peptide/nickel transport system substrate-binding protein|nr:ABC transporter substrate-binding protein [Syntrophaceticus schinkii]
MPKKRSLTLVISLLVLLTFSCGLLYGCKIDKAKETSKTEGKKTADVIKLAGGDYGYLTPYAHYPRGPGIFKMRLIFDSLLERDEKGYINWLAEKYEIKENGKQYLFTIRDGVKWHDGKPLTAEDVKFSFEYAIKHPMVSSTISEKDIEKVEEVGDRQVMVTVKKPSAVMLSNLGTSRIIPKHIWEKVDNPKEFLDKEAVIGCGPYVLTDYSKEHGTYRLEAFKDYWGPKQRVKVIEFIPVSEGILAFEQGEVDMTGVTPDVLQRFEKDPDCKIVKAPAFWGYRMLFNMGETAVFQEKELRQAFCYAMDKQDMIDKVQRGAGVPGCAGILPPDHVMYNSKAKQYDHNPKQAEELLVKLGYDKLENGVRVNSKGEKLSFNLLVGGEVRLAEIIKEHLGKVGIEVTVQSVDGKTRDARVQDNKYQLAITGHGGWGNDADYLRERFSSEKKAGGGISPNLMRFKGYSNPELSELLEKQFETIDENERKKQIFKAQELLAEDVPEIPIYYTTGYTVYKPAKYDGWMFMFDHHSLEHSKLSYLERN